MELCRNWVALVVACCACTSVVLAQDIFAESVLEVHIEFADPHWRDTLLDAKSAGDNRRMIAQVKINNKIYPDVQVRFKGNSSFHGAIRAGIKKLPLNLKASDEWPFDGGYETLKLANNYRDPSGIREMLAYRIAADYVPVPHCTYAIVYVDDEYLGVYTATEGVGGSMIERYFCGKKKGLIQAEPDFDAPTPSGCAKGNYASLDYLGEDFKCYSSLYEVKDHDLWKQLIRLTRVLNDSTSKVYEILDVHLALWMHALNNVLVNLDSYLGFFCHNYYLYHDSTGIFHPLLWDFNLAFGGFHVLKPGVDVNFVTLSPIVHERLALMHRPLITKLMEDQTTRRVYFAMMRTIIDQWFVNKRYIDIAENLQERIRPYIEMEKGTFYKKMDFENNLRTSVKTTGRTVPGIVELMTARTKYLDQHPLLTPINLSVERWEAVKFQDSIHVKVETHADVQSVRVWYQQANCLSFRNVDMQRVSQTADFECLVPGNTIAFYCELAGPDNANLWPLEAPRHKMAIVH